MRTTTFCIALLFIAAPASAQFQLDSEHNGTLAAPPAWAGADLDGALRSDELGDLVVDADTMRAFDGLLLGTADELSELTRARADLLIGQSVAPRAALQAIELFDRYLQMRQRAADLVALASPATGPVELLAELDALRDEVFGHEKAARLFASKRVEELRAVEIETARRNGKNLRSAVDPVLALQDQEAELLRLGAAPAKIYELRLANYGADTAKRLATVDAGRADFESRLASYRADLVSSSDQAELLRGRYFSGPELLRIDALDRIDGLSD